MLHFVQAVFGFVVGWFVAHTWAIILASTILYVASVILIVRVTEYFFGYKAGNVVTFAIGFPILGILWLSRQVVRGATWPWRFRTNRLFKETFKVYPKDEGAENEVNRELGSRARYLESVFLEERAGRSTSSEVKSSKEYFWSAHALAQKNDIYVYESYKDYFRFK